MFFPGIMFVQGGEVRWVHSLCKVGEEVKPRNSVGAEELISTTTQFLSFDHFPLFLTRDIFIPPFLFSSLLKTSFFLLDTSFELSYFET